MGQDILVSLVLMGKSMELAPWNFQTVPDTMASLLMVWHQDLV